MILTGKCEEQLKAISEESIDFICSDVPYGLTNLDPLKLIQDDSVKGKGFMNKDWDNIPTLEALTECHRVLKPGAFMALVFTPRQDAQVVLMYRLLQVGFKINFTPIYWTYHSGFPKAGDTSKLIDKRLGAETEEAKRFEGSKLGYQPKPAVEVVMIAMKPLSEKSYLDQALKNGKGITWLDRGRIPFVSENDKPQASTAPDLRDVGRISKKEIGVDKISFGQAKGAERIEYDVNSQGRFPANLLISDDVFAPLGESKSGFMEGQQGGFGGSTLVYGKNSTIPETVCYADEGSQSRYYNLDLWFEKRLEKLPAQVRATFPFLVVPKPSKKEKNAGLTDGNNHMTVKPIKLMTYLLEIFSDKDDTILDPYAGSGTTLLAAKMIGRKYIGIEMTEEFISIIEARLEAGEPLQPTLFDNLYQVAI